jgi:uncharacterized protein (DUF924 family)
MLIINDKEVLMLDPMVDDILKFWFGRIEETVVPSRRRARVWFGDCPEVSAEIKDRYTSLLVKPVQAISKKWAHDPHGRLALILLVDQFSRHIYHGQPEAYEHDKFALKVCKDGIKSGADHALSLIERVFYYFPLLHSEKISDQNQGISAYQQLAALSLPETKTIYDSFLRFAQHHFQVISEFGRFPQRNEVLGRRTTSEEMIYLRESDLGDV